MLRHEVSLNFPELFITEKYEKSVLKTIGFSHTTFSVLEVKNSKKLQKLKKETVFVSIIGFSFYDVSHAKTDLHDKHMIYLSLRFLFWTRSPIKLNYSWSLCEKMT